jgi:hypothetical protein
MITDSMEVLAPSGASVTYRGEKLDVRPVEVGTIPSILRTSRKVIDALFDQPQLPAGGSDDELTMLLNLITNHGEEVISTAALCVNKPEEWVKKGDAAEFFELARTILQVNRDFFIQKLAPLLGGRAAELASLMQVSGAGQTPSSS